MWKMSFCKSDQKSMPMVGFLTCNDSDILRAKTGPYRCVGYQTNIPPTMASRMLSSDFEKMWRIVDFQTGGPTVSPLLLIYMCWKSNMISDRANRSVLLAVHS